MDKPTSEKDVIKSLPPDGKLIETIKKHYQKTKSQDSEAILAGLRLVKPVFDKMLAVLKEYVHNYKTSENHVDLRKAESIIKEAEELGL